MYSFHGFWVWVCGLTVPIMYTVVYFRFSFLAELPGMTAEPDTVSSTSRSIVLSNLLLYRGLSTLICFHLYSGNIVHLTYSVSEYIIFRPQIIDCVLWICRSSKCPLFGCAQIPYKIHTISYYGPYRSHEKWPGLSLISMGTWSLNGTPFRYID